MFKAAGYRIGPSEIENCLVKHPAVANAAVVPSPDETRGNVVKAFIVLAPGHAPSHALEDDIAQHVRQHLAPYEYPKEIEFIDALPMTTTGKVQRKVLREREAARKRALHEPAADGGSPFAVICSVHAAVQLDDGGHAGVPVICTAHAHARASGGLLAK